MGRVCLGFFFSSRRRHTRFDCDWSSDVCSSDLVAAGGHETEVGSVLLLLGMPADIPVVAVGASTSHRVAAQAVAAGASDYFALPDDPDGLRDAPPVPRQRPRAALRRAPPSPPEAQAPALPEIGGGNPPVRARPQPPTR